MKAKILFMCTAALLFAGCKPIIKPFTPVEVDCEAIYIKWIYEPGVTDPAEPEVRIINSVADYLPLEIEFSIGEWTFDTLKVPISDINFVTQQIVVVISERIIQDGYDIQLDSVIEYENHIEVSIRKIQSMLTSTGRMVMFILMSKTSKTIQTKWFFRDRV